jgi:FkbM family methyltransferase
LHCGATLAILREYRLRASGADSAGLAPVPHWNRSETERIDTVLIRRHHSSMGHISQINTAAELRPASPASVARRILRDAIVGCLGLLPVQMKVWAMRYLERPILAVLFRLEKGHAVISQAGPARRRFRMRLSWRGHMYYVVGFYEPELIRTLEQHLKKGDGCIDVGGHVGYLSIIMAHLVGPQGRVVTFEPVPENYAALVENIEINNLRNATPECAAVGETEGTMELICTQGERLSWTASAKGYSSPTDDIRISVPVVSLDKYLQSNRLKPSLIKIDVEGAELLVLRGARRTLREVRPLILVEIHDLGEQHRGTKYSPYSGIAATRRQQWAAGIVRFFASPLRLTSAPSLPR